MHLRYIELFHAVLATGSLTGAAKLLNISQPAASKALQHAEDQLGFAMFSRVRGRLQPTQQALLLRHRIDSVMQELRDLQRLTASIRQPGNAPLRITCTPTLALTVLPEVVLALRKSFPATTIELSTQHSAVMAESLLLREYDLGVTLQNTGAQNLHQEALCCGQVMVIAPPGWWRADELRRPLPINALAGQPLIGIAARDALGNMLQSHLAQVDPAPKAAVWVQTYQLAYSLVSHGQGLALVDPFTARCGIGTPVQTRPLKLKLDVNLYAVYRADNPLNAVQKRFVSQVRQVAQRLLAH